MILARNAALGASAARHESESDVGVDAIQRGERLHEFQRGHDDMSGTVPVGTFALQHHLASTIALEPFVGNGRAGDIAAKAFEFLALVGAIAHARVHAKAVELGAQTRRR